MSRPVVVSTSTPGVSRSTARHQCVGIWKSPRNFPVSGPVSTRVNPVAPNPESVTPRPASSLSQSVVLAP